MVKWGIMMTTNSLDTYKKYARFRGRMNNLLGYHVPWREAMILALKVEVINQKDVLEMFGNNIALEIEKKMIGNKGD